MTSAVALDLGARKQAGSLSPIDFATIAEVVHRRSGIVLGADKAYLIEARLEPVMRRRGLLSLGALSARLRQRADDGLTCDVIDAMTTNETLFFRDVRPFEHLRKHALPMLQANWPGRPLRIWSAASSSGQEPYSIALSVLDAPRGSRPVQILGTDISGEQIARARRGVYSEFEVSRGLMPDTLARHFTSGPGTWQISDAIRRMVEFRVWNLLDDAGPLGSFDVVFCRNVLFYFNVETKRRVLKTISERLLPGGLLYLGGQRQSTASRTGSRRSRAPFKPTGQSSYERDVRTDHPPPW